MFSVGPGLLLGEPTASFDSHIILLKDCSADHIKVAFVASLYVNALTFQSYWQPSGKFFTVCWRVIGNSLTNLL